MTNATHRSEHTGDQVLDRVQGVVRDAITKLNAAVARIAVLERTIGTGVASVVMADIDAPVSPSDFAKSVYIITGAHTGTRKLTLPRAADDTAYSRWVVNLTTGGFAINVSTGTGTIVSVPNGSSKNVFATASGARLLT